MHYWTGMYSPKWIVFCCWVYVCVPLPNNPKSPPFFAELQSLNWLARVSNFCSPDLMSSMYSTQIGQRKDRLNKLISFDRTAPPLHLNVLLTLNEVQGLFFRSCDILFPPRRWTTWLIVFYQEVRAAYLSKKKQTNKAQCQNIPESTELLMIRKKLEMGLLIYPVMNYWVSDFSFPLSNNEYIQVLDCGSGKTSNLIFLVF